MVYVMAVMLMLITDPQLAGSVGSQIDSDFFAPFRYDKSLCKGTRTRNIKYHNNQANLLHDWMDDGTSNRGGSSSELHELIIITIICHNLRS